jgi:tRNA(Ile)-lysidine synthase
MESDLDEQAVAEFAQQLDTLGGPSVSCISVQESVADLKCGICTNLEAAARYLRYEWLAKVARREGARLVATGHTAGDQAETVLFHLLRGSGLKGLRGIAPRRKLWGDLVLVRPLLRVTRSEVLEYLKARDLTYREDSSNNDISFTRNRIRHQLIPSLARNFNPGIVEALCRLATEAREEFRHVQRQARDLLRSAELPQADGTLVFSRDRLSQAQRNLVREAFRLVWERQGWRQRQMGFDQWNRLVEVARGHLKAADLPGHIRAIGRERVIQLMTRR